MGLSFIRDFSVLDHLAPYDVLIGRDILREGRMYIDGVRVTFGSTSRTERLRKGEFSGPRVAARIAANRLPTMS